MLILGVVTALKEGRTRIVLHDRNVDANDPNVKLPSATLHIVQPAYMTLTLLPYNNWEILLSEHHDIVVDVFSRYILNCYIICDYVKLVFYLINFI